MPQVDPVILQLKADVADYQRDLTRAQRLTEEKLDRIGQAGTRTGVAIRKGFDFAKGAAIGFVASIGIETIAAAVKTGLEYAASLGEVAQQLGVTTDALQEYRYAGSQAGLSTEETDQALSQLTRRIGEAAEGTKAQAEAFEKLGISVKGANGEVIDAGEAIPLIADALQKIESPAERAAILMDLFGRAGQKLEPLLSGGAAGVDNLRNAAHRLGIVLSEDQINRADETADKLDAMKQVLQSRIAGAVADNANAILALASAFERLVIAAGNAVTAYQRFKLNQGKIQADLNARFYGASPLPSDQRKAAGFRRESMQYQTALGNLDATPVKPGEVRTLSGKTYTYKVTPTSGNSGRTRLVGGDDTPRLPSSLDRVLGAPGQGPGIAALLGVDPAAATKAADEITVEMQRLAADIAAAQADLTSDLADDAAARKQQIDAELAATLERADANEDLTGEQRAQLKAMETQRASLEKQAVDQQLAEDLSRERKDAEEKTADAARANARFELDALSAEADLADTRDGRLAIERRILTLRQQAERDALEEQIANGEILDAAKARADLTRRQSAEGGRLERDFEGPLARYGRDARNANDRVEEAAARRIADLNDTIADTMAKRLGVKDPFLRDLLSIFLDQNIFGPLADALSRRSSGGGGLFGSILSGIGSLFGGKSGGGLAPGLNKRASGGRVNAGTMYRVNEGATEGRVEAFVPQGSGDIIPLGRIDAMRGGQAGSGQVTVRLMLSDDIDARIDQRSAGVAVEVVRGAAPGIVKASVGETMRQAGRPRL